MVRRGSVMVAALALGVSLVASAASADSKSDEAAIRALEARFGAAVEAEDLDAVMKVYAPGQDLFVFDIVPPRQYVGADAYRADWKGFLSSFKGPIKFEMSDLAIDSDGTLAWSHSIQRVSGVGANGQPSDMTVRVTDVYRKVGGEWRIVHEHVSVPVDLASGKGDLQSKP